MPFSFLIQLKASGHKLYAWLDMSTGAQLKSSELCLQEEIEISVLCLECTAPSSLVGRRTSHWRATYCSASWNIKMYSHNDQELELNPTQALQHSIPLFLPEWLHWLNSDCSQNRINRTKKTFLWFAVWVFCPLMFVYVKCRVRINHWFSLYGITHGHKNVHGGSKHKLSGYQLFDNVIFTLNLQLFFLPSFLFLSHKWLFRPDSSILLLQI